MTDNYCQCTHDAMGINGPPLHEWNAEKYVVSRFKMGKHGALDKRTGTASKPVEVETSTKLFAEYR